MLLTWTAWPTGSRHVRSRGRNHTHAFVRAGYFSDEFFDALRNSSDISTLTGCENVYSTATGPATTSVTPAGASETWYPVMRPDNSTLNANAFFTMHRLHWMVIIIKASHTFNSTYHADDLVPGPNGTHITVPRQALPPVGFITTTVAAPNPPPPSPTLGASQLTASLQHLALVLLAAVLLLSQLC